MSFLFNNPVEKIIEIFRDKMRFKDETREKDIVVVIKEMQNNVTVVDYAQVMEFARYQTKRDEWWSVSLTFLNFPLAHNTYILQTSQFTGKEVFTMGGKKVFIKAVDTTKPPFSDPKGDGKERPFGKPSFTLVK